MKCVVYELDSSSQVFLPLCCSCRQIERSLLFIFLSVNPPPALLWREESSLICYLAVGSKQVHKQKENRFADPARLTKKALVQDTSWRERGHPLVFFQAMIRNLRHQKSLKKVKKCKKVKVKAFFRRWSNRRRLPSLLDRRSQKSRSSLIWRVPSSFFGNIYRAIFLSENAFLRNIRKQAKK